MNNVNTEINILNERLAFKINMALLSIHIGLLISFTFIWAPIMILMNLLSVAIYITLFKVIQKNLVMYLFVTFAEILAHMIVATVCLGWECGFQLYSFAVVPIVFHCYNLAKRTGLMKLNLTPMIISIVACFFAARIHNFFLEPIYHLSDYAASTIIYSINSFIVFAFLVVYLSLHSSMEYKIEELLHRTAEFDALTGLANRYRIHEVFDRLTNSSSDKSEEFSVAIMDIDNFKNVNDTYGHMVGDKVLKMVADILKSVENDQVHCSRWGGEEFLVVVSGSKSLDTATALLELIRVNISKGVVKEAEKDIQITISTGIALHNVEESILATIGRADTYLYEAKMSGKNKVITNDKY